MSRKQSLFSCSATIEEARKARRGKSQPWIVLKFAVGLTIAIVGYASYVYIVRLCVPMLRRDSGAPGGRIVGIIFLVGFSFLLLMTTWAYAKVIFTSPGHAKDYIPKSEQPLIPARRFRQSIDSNISDIGTPYATTHPNADPSHNPVAEPPRVARTSSQKRSGSQSESKARPVPQDSSSPNTRRPSLGSRSHRASHSSHTRTGSQRHATLARVTDTRITPPPPVHNSGQVSTSQVDEDATQLWRTSRRPPTTPILLPEYRFCSRDGLLKPFRTHHCRTCGTCVLKYDHHCPWVGQCVGARNQKFFVNFLQWASICGLWIFVTTLTLYVKTSKDINVIFDPQKVVVIALSGVFGFFTAAMLFSQTHLILLNQTTVESMVLRSMREREKATLNRLHPWYSFGAKRRTKNSWDEEWGKLDTEGNIWWLGSRKANWEAVMGRNPWWWFLPIGHSASDGLTYDRNPRFDEQGRLQRRKEWPVELR